MPPSQRLPDMTGAVVDCGQLELLRVVGTGAYGKIYKARKISSRTTPTPYDHDTNNDTDDDNHNAFYAVKCLRVPRPESRDAHFQERERTFHRLVSSHANVISFHHTFTTPHHVFMVYDYAPGGDMYHAILQGRYKQQDGLVRRVFAALVDGVRWCHAQGVYHRDLKPENVLVDRAGGNPRIADFGLCTRSRLSRDFDCGSHSYMCPESFSGASTYGYRPRDSDAWALSTLLLNLVTGMNPWHGAQIGDARWMQFRANPDSYLPTILPISRPLNTLAARCFRLEPTRRPSLGTIRHEVLFLPALFATPEELRVATPGVRRALGLSLMTHGQQQQQHQQHQQLPRPNRSQNRPDRQPPSPRSPRPPGLVHRLVTASIAKPRPLIPSDSGEGSEESAARPVVLQLPSERSGSSGDPRSVEESHNARSRVDGGRVAKRARKLSLSVFSKIVKSLKVWHRSSKYSNRDELAVVSPP